VTLATPPERGCRDIHVLACVTRTRTQDAGHSVARGRRLENPRRVSIEGDRRHSAGLQTGYRSSLSIAFVMCSNNDKSSLNDRLCQLVVRLIC